MQALSSEKPKALWRWSVSFVRGWFYLDAASQSHLRGFGGPWTPNTRSPAPDVVVISGDTVRIAVPFPCLCWEAQAP